MRGAYYWADRLASLLAASGAVMAMIMALFVTLAVIMRYVFGTPFGFTEELVGLLFIALVFSGLPVCTLRNSHISVTIVPDLLNGSSKRIVEGVAYAGIAIFCIWFGMLSFEYLQTALALNARTTSSRLLLWPWVAVLPSSCFLSALAALIRIMVPPKAATEAPVERSAV